MFRELPAEEAMMWDEAAKGIPFGVLCSMLATYDDPDTRGGARRGLSARLGHERAFCRVFPPDSERPDAWALRPNAISSST